MAGTLTISTLSDGTNSTSSTNCIQGSAKAWVRFTGSTGAIAGSYNVSSITRTGAGQWTVNFTNAMANANYSVVGGNSGAGGYGYVMMNQTASSEVAPSTTNFKMTVINSSASAFVDSAYTSAVVFD